MRLRAAVAGSGLALVTALLIDHGGHLGPSLTSAALLGVALGAALGLVTDGSLPGRVGMFVAGVAAAWLGYALRAGVLPDIPLGRAIAGALVLGIVVALAVATDGRMPLWAGLLGAAALAGAYEATFTASPTTFVHDAFSAVTAVLLAAAVGLLLGVLGADLASAQDHDRSRRLPHARHDAAPAEESTAGLDLVSAEPRPSPDNRED